MTIDNAYVLCRRFTYQVDKSTCMPFWCRVLIVFMFYFTVAWVGGLRTPQMPGNLVLTGQARFITVQNFKRIDTKNKLTVDSAVTVNGLVWTLTFL